MLVDMNPIARKVVANTIFFFKKGVFVLLNLNFPSYIPATAAKPMVIGIIIDNILVKNRKPWHIES